jgi:glycosyltransferase involved in cell wall biosynthesis
MSRVDVIIPCYNYGHFLGECVGSVLGQDGVDVRVLILDDASPDHTPEVGGQLAQRDPRVEYRRHAVNHGHIATYNEGLKWASGEYTLLLSADDLLTPGALARAAAVMDAHAQVGLTYGREIKTACPSPHQFTVPERTSALIHTGPEFVEACCRACDNLVPTPTAVVRTTVQHRVGGYRPELPHAGDLEMWLRFAAHGSVAALDSQQAYYRVHPKNMSVRYRGIPDLLQVRAAFYGLFEAHGAELDARGLLFDVARTNVASQFFWLGHRFFDEGDMAGCEECLRHTLDTFPGWASRPEWLRFRCKRLMGYRAWSRIRRLFRQMQRAVRPTRRVDSVVPRCSS